MPVAVHVPIRLRLSAEALVAHPGAIDRAVSRAVGRALERSRAEVLERTGGYLDVRLGMPAIAWSGPGLPAVPEAARRATDGRITALIAVGARAAGLDAPVQAPQPLLGGRAAEPFDLPRARAFDRYLVDSYDGGVDVITIRRPGSARTDDLQVPFVREWEVAEVGPDYDRAYVRARIQGEAAAQGVTLAAVYGIIVRGSAGWTVILSADGFSGARTISLSFGRQVHRRAARRGERVIYSDEELVPSLTAASATQIALPSDADARADALNRLFAPKLRTELRDLFDPSEEMDDRLLTEEELAALIEQETQAAMAAVTAQIGNAPFLLRIDWGDVVFNIALRSSLAAQIGWDGSTPPATILPSVTEIQKPGALPIGTGSEEGAQDPAPHARQGNAGRGGQPQEDGSRYGTGGDAPADGQGAAIFPSLGLGAAFVCEPFLGAEPGLEQLTTDGAALRRIVAEIAERLDMAPCDYPATFCVGAAATLQVRAEAVGAFADRSTIGELTQPPQGARTAAASDGGGNLGHATFRPTASRGIQLLRRLAQAAVRVAELRRMIRRTYLDGEGRGLLGGRYAANPVGWVLRFEEAVSPAMLEGVGAIFAQACQVIMLQLLETSAQQIAARRRNLGQYAPLFREILIRNLSDIGGLTALRDRLRTHELAQSASAAAADVRDFTLSAGHGGRDSTAIGAIGIAAWAEAARGVADAFVAMHGASYAPGAAQEIVTEGGVARIRDAHGFLWTREALERAIVEQRGGAESIDPLMQQLADMPETVEQFRRQPEAAEAILADLLADMARLNEAKRQEAANDPLFGLQAGRIQETTQHAQVPGLTYALGGIHLLAHEQIGSFFRGDDAYADGIDHVFSVELGKQGIEHFFVLTGLVLLAVVCAPAAFVAGVAVAAREVSKAKSRAGLYRALINPELVLNRAEIELELYIAYVGFALALLPEAGTAARAISAGVRGAARGGLVAGARLAAQSVVRQVSRQVTEQLARELLPALIKELTINLLIEQVIVPTVVGPMIAAVERELSLRTSVGGQAGAERLIDEIEAAAAARAARPLPGQAVQAAP